MDLNPFDLAGVPFLELYGVLLMLALTSSIMITRANRPLGRADVGVRDPDQLAFLAGGADRLAEAVTTRLLASGRLVMDGTSSFVATERGLGGSTPDEFVLDLPAPIRWTDIRKALTPHAAQTERELVAHGALTSRGEMAVMRWRGTLPLVLLLAFGGIRLAIGIERHRPVGFLAMLLMITAVLAAVLRARLQRTTVAGQTELAAIRERSSRLQRAPTTPEADLAVALFGTTVLAGSGWGAFHDLRTAASSGGADGSSGGCGAGAGGDGGGGCGGCGGGGH